MADDQTVAGSARGNRRTRSGQGWRVVVATCGTVLVAGSLTVARPPVLGSTARSAGCKQASGAGTTVQTIAAGSAPRTYRLAVPSGSGPFGLILNFHGLGSNAIQQAIYSQLEQKGPQRGYIVVTPQGTGSPAYWNIIPQPLGPNPDDVAFASTLLDHLEQTLCVDPGRVYSTGISNGAGFTTLLGCRLTTRLAAIAPVAGINLVAPCPRGTPLSVLAFHGTRDPVVPYGGGPVLRSLHAASAPGAIASWAQRDHCAAKPVTKTLTPQVLVTTYRGCVAGYQVLLYSVDGGGHTWPGSLDVATLGFTTHDINAADLMLAFFAHHVRPQHR